MFDWLHKLILDINPLDDPTYIITDVHQKKALENMILEDMDVNASIVVMSSMEWLQHLATQLRLPNTLSFYDVISHLKQKRYMFYTKQVDQISHLERIYQQIIINETWSISRSDDVVLNDKINDTNIETKLSFLSHLKKQTVSIQAKEVYYVDLSLSDLMLLKTIKTSFDIQYETIPNHELVASTTRHQNRESQYKWLLNQLLEQPLTTQLVVVPDMNSQTQFIRYCHQVHLPYQTSMPLYLKDDPLGQALIDSLNHQVSIYYEGVFESFKQWVEMIQQPLIYLSTTQQQMLNLLIQKIATFDQLEPTLLIDCLIHCINHIQVNFKGFKDGVHIALQEAVPMTAYERVYVLECHHDTYPSNISLPGLLTKDDYQQLATNGVLTPFTQDLRQASFDRFKQHLAFNKKEVILSGLIQDHDKACLKHEWFDVYEPYVSQVSMKQTTLMHHQYKKIESLPTFNNQPTLSQTSIDNLNKHITSKSVSQIETYNQCPYRYFVGYYLKPNIERNNEIAITIGVLVHELLKQLMLEDSQFETTWETFCETHQDELNTLSDATILHLKRMVNHSFEMLEQQKEAGKFNLFACEYPISHVIGGHQFKGIIDRIDMVTQGDITYVFVLDYKTGDKKATLDKIYVGLDIQLFVYVYLLIEKLKQLGQTVYFGGLYYYHVYSPIITSVPVEKARLNSYGYSGYTLKQPSLISQISGHEIKIIQGGLKKDGELKIGDYLTSQAYEAMQEVVLGQMLLVMDAMKQGQINIEPVNYDKQPACTFCDYKLICMKDKQLNPERVIQKQSDDVIRALLEGGQNDVETI